MRFTGMVAVRLRLGAICRKTDGLAGQQLPLMVGGVTLLLLAIALVVSTNDALRQARELHLARALRMEVVAEGVETAAQHAVLRELGCDVLQGYLHARPMPADAVAPWLAQHAATTTAPAEPEPVASASIAA